MSAAELFRAGKLDEAIQALGAEIRANPTDAKRRTFLFELLCFAGDFDRAAKHLGVLAGESANAEVGALLYRSALTAENQRQAAFQAKAYPDAPALPCPPGTLNGKPFQTLEDADPRIGARLEVFVAGEYVWLPFAYIASLQMDPPRFLRDLLWPSARLTAAPGARIGDLGEVLIPALYPFSSRYPQDAVRLGRATEWQAADGQELPFGQKLLIVDGEEVIPYLEIRELLFASGESADAGTSATSAA